MTSAVPKSAPIRWYGLSIVALLLAWVGCYLPWIATKGAALSSNLPDLAEWMTLNPYGRGSALLTPLALRGVFGLIAVALANLTPLLTDRLLRWVVRVQALLIAIGLLPPFDFFRTSPDDPNYRQQFLITLLTCAGVLIAWRRPIRVLAVPAVILAIVCGGLGVLASVSAWAALKLQTGVGIGALLTLLALLTALVLMLIAARRKVVFS